MERITLVTEAHLSRLQQRILRQLRVQMAWIHAHGNARAQVVLFVWGVPWRPGAYHARWTNAKRAAYSRALRRLERRGLLLRVRRGRKATSRRTTHVRLLPCSEAVVQRNTHDRAKTHSTADVNRLRAPRRRASPVSTGKTRRNSSSPSPQVNDRRTPQP
jgi:hypothetical protein